MRASRPSYSPALQALRNLKASRASIASRKEIETVDEVLQRLRRLDNQVGQLINTNNTFIEHRTPRTKFDTETDTYTVRVGGVEQKIKLKRADPNRPIQMRTLDVGGGYKAGRAATEENEQSQTELMFEGILEDYYQNAHRVLKLVKTLPGLTNFVCREITIVRNKLVEHPEEGEPYSFGFGSTGPVVRPMHSPGREWIDAGLAPNTEVFVKALTNAFEKRIDASGASA